VNAGNTREHLTELSANAAMLWRFHEFSADDFLREHCGRYYGAGQAGETADLYREYYDAFWQQKPADIPGFKRQYLFQDMRYARAAEMFLKDMEAGVRRENPLANHPMDNPDHGSPGYFRVEPLPGPDGMIEAILRGTRVAGERFGQVGQKADRLLPLLEKGQTFFNDNLRVPAHLMKQLNRMLHEIALAYRAFDDPVRRRRHLLAAHEALESAEAFLAETRHGPFSRWHEHDEKFGLAKLKARIARAASEGGLSVTERLGAPT
jgi:hypothetical protein